MALALVGGMLIDGTGARPREADVVCEGSSIASVAASQAPRDAQLLDVRGLTVLPGLIDGHAHLALVFDFAAQDMASPAEIAAQTFRNCELALQAGFTSVRDMGGLDGGVAGAIEKGLVAGPRVFPSGAAIVQTGGHGHLCGPFAHVDTTLALPGLVQMIQVCDGPDAVTLAARNNFRRGATQLKVFVSGGVVSATDRLEDTQLTVEELRAAVAEAEARETYVAGHAHNVRAIANGIAAGLKCFEHGTFLDEATAAAMAKAGAALDPTLAVCRLMADEWQKWKLPEAVVPRVAGCESAMAESMKMARAAGVLIGSGSDLLGTEQNRRGLEITLQARVLGAMEAIICATAGNAKIMRCYDRLGSVEAGKFADLIALEGDPLAQPELFDQPEKVRLVIKGGRIVKNTL